jgi:hypothetical protein
MPKDNESNPSKSLQTGEVDYKNKLKKILADNHIYEFEISHNTVIGGDDFMLNVKGNITNGLLNMSKTVTELDENAEIPPLRFFSPPKLIVKKQGSPFLDNIILPNNNYPNLYKAKTFDNEVYREIYESISGSLTKGGEELLLKEFKKFGVKIQNQLNHEFYKDVDIAVNIQVRNEDGKVIKGGDLTYKTNDDIKINDIVIQIFLDADGTVSINHKVNNKYLEEFEEKWSLEASERGLDLDISAMRQEVIHYFNSELAEKSFKDRFLQEVKSWWDDGVGNYIEAVQSTQKITKHIWEEGTINRGIWHSTNEDAKEYQLWPEYMHLYPVLGGAIDGIVDEIVGIPLACKSIYEIATDDEKKQAFAQVFTKEGFNAILGGIKQQARDIRDDEEIKSHFAGQTTVMAGTMLVPGAQATKLKKLDDLTEVVTKAGKQSDEFIDGGKTLEKLSRLKKVVRHVEAEKALDDLLKEFGSDVFESNLDELLEAAETTSKKEWLKVLAKYKLGRILEDNVTNLIQKQLIIKSGKYIEELAHKFGKSVEELAEMTQIRQLQIALPNGNWTVLDDVFVETIKDASGIPIGYKLLVNETKLSKLADLSINQKEFLKLLKEGTTNFSTRSLSKSLGTSTLAQGTEVTIEKYIKTMGNGVEEAIDLTTEILF